LFDLEELLALLSSYMHKVYQRFYILSSYILSMKYLLHLIY
jgi:hypothetical protein